MKKRLEYWLTDEGFEEVISYQPSPIVLLRRNSGWCLTSDYSPTGDALCIEVSYPYPFLKPQYTISVRIRLSIVKTPLMSKQQLKPIYFGFLSNFIEP